MARPDENEAAVGQLKSTVWQLLSLESKVLKIQEQFGPTAADAVPPVSGTANLFRNLVNRDNLPQLPGMVIEDLTRNAQKRMSDFNQLQSVTAQPGLGPQAWGGAVAQARQGYAEAFKVVAPVIAFLNDRRPDTESFEKEAKTTLERLETLEKTYQTATVAATEKIQSTLAGVRQAAQEAGLAEYAQFFKTQADEHKTGAKRWLILVAVISGLTLAAAAGLFYYYLTLAMGVTTEASQTSRGVAALATAEGVQLKSVTKASDNVA